jgi:hypothetical protein
MSDLAFLNLQKIMKRRGKKKKKNHCQKCMIRTVTIWRMSLKEQRVM